MCAARIMYQLWDLCVSGACCWSQGGEGHPGLQRSDWEGLSTGHWWDLCVCEWSCFLLLGAGRGWRPVVAAPGGRLEAVWEAGRVSILSLCVSLEYTLSCATSSPCEGESCSHIPQPGQRPQAQPGPQWPGRIGAGLEWLQGGSRVLNSRHHLTKFLFYI